MLRQKMGWVAAAVLLGSAPLHAEEKPTEAKPDTYWVVIVGGGKSAAPAEKAARAVREEKNGWLKLPEGYPQVRESATVAGLKPGFHVALAGFCADEQQALWVRDLLDWTTPGTYVRQVQGDFAGLCPERTFPQAKMDEARVAARAPAGKEFPRFELRVLESLETCNSSTVGKYPEWVSVELLQGEALVASSRVYNSCNWSEVERAELVSTSERTLVHWRSLKEVTERSPNPDDPAIDHLEFYRVPSSRLDGVFGLKLLPAFELGEGDFKVWAEGATLMVQEGDQPARAYVYSKRRDEYVPLKKK
jgi:hypothetical protein